MPSTTIGALDKQDVAHDVARQREIRHGANGVFGVSTGEFQAPERDTGPGRQAHQVCVLGELLETMLGDG